MFSSKRVLLTLLSLAILCIGSAATVRADVIIAGSTSGCFGPNCSPEHATSVIDLTFSGGCFGCAAPTGIIQIGTFTLGSLPADYTGQTFTLLINFAGPTFPNPATFTATLTGSVDAGGDGSLLIHFMDSPRIFASIDFGECSFCSNRPASFIFHINDLNLRPGENAIVTANAGVIPEPATIFLLGTSLMGAAGWSLKRRKARG